MKTKKRAKKIALVEICRSFSYKLNVGNFESRDFFMSQKGECKPADAEKVSEAMHEFCKKMVIRDVNKFLAGKEPLQEKPEPKKRDMANFYERKDEKQSVKEAVMMDAAQEHFDS